MHSRCSSVSPFMFLLFSAAADVVVAAVGADEDCFFLAASDPLEVSFEDPPVPLEDPSETDLTRAAASLEDDSFFFLASPFGVAMRLRGIFGILIGLLKTPSSPLFSGSDAALKMMFDWAKKVKTLNILSWGLDLSLF